MAPEFTVYVPRGKEKEFEEALSTIDGAFVRHESKSDPHEYQGELVRMLDMHREMMELLRGKKDAPFQGYLELISAIQRKTGLFSRFPEDPNKVKDIFHQEFERCLNENPQNVRSGDITRTSWGKYILNPTQVRVLIARFGLDDGVLKPMSEVSSILACTEKEASSFYATAMQKLRDQAFRGGPLSNYFNRPHNAHF